MADEIKNLWDFSNNRLAQIFAALMLISAVGATWGLERAVEQSNAAKLEKLRLEKQIALMDYIESTGDSSIKITLDTALKLLEKNN